MKILLLKLTIISSLRTNCKQGQAQDAALALARAIKARAAKPGDGGTTENVSRNIAGLAEALLLQPPKEGEGEGELGGALVAVNHINLLGWRYFVQHQAWQGRDILQQVLLIQSTTVPPVSFTHVRAGLCGARLRSGGRERGRERDKREIFSVWHAMCGVWHRGSKQRVSVIPSLRVGFLQVDSVWAARGGGVVYVLLSWGTTNQHLRALLEFELPPPTPPPTARFALSVLHFV